MHILTKIFIVLVSLMSVFLVPLVVVYAYNENNYKAQLDQAVAKAAAANATLQDSQLLATAEKTRLEAKVQEMVNSLTNVDKDLAKAQDDVNLYKQRLVATDEMKAAIDSKLTVLAASVEAAQKLTGSLVEDLKSVRSEMVAKAQQNVELDNHSRELENQLDVAVAARKALQEENSRLQDEVAKVMAKLGQLKEGGVDIDRVSAGAARGGIRPNVSMTCNVTGVERAKDHVWVQIDAGSRDGVQKDWILNVGNGGRFVGNLRIIKVDVDQSTGELSLEEPSNPVQIGYRAYTSAE